SLTVDLFAYDVDEPDIIKMLEALGPRLRAFLDNASLHTGTALEVQAHTRLVNSAGLSNVKQGHFQRFAHDKVIIEKKNGVPVKVLTGSANFSVRGLYVQANNVLVFNDSHAASLYEEAFDQAWKSMSDYPGSKIASQWFTVGVGVNPRTLVSFAPHESATVSLDKVADEITNADRSVLYAVMQLGGGGRVMEALQELRSRSRIFSYGV